MNYQDHYKRNETPQTEQADARQQENNAGGWSFTVDKWKRLERFLILGAEGGTYYVSERALTRDNAKSVDACLSEDPAGHRLTAKTPRRTRRRQQRTALALRHRAS